ncbi:rCG50426 [Rattus norvegicus]|uniref:RCG50426 n=1 Tax=Rattus norvegicus TaxID=10116 RepID=A6JYQ0_RAT|nr:rCG50426 [Rattus norvegicus]
MQLAPAGLHPACQLCSAVNRNSTVKVRCMLKRHGLIYPENPALLEVL